MDDQAGPGALVGQAGAPSGDFLLGRVHSALVFAVDLADLAADDEAGSRLMQELRSTGELGLALAALDGSLAGCVPSRENIVGWMRDEVALGGKAVWAEPFLDRHSPWELPVPQELPVGEDRLAAGQRASLAAGSALSAVVYRSSGLRLFRDGTVVFTVRVDVNEPSGVVGGGAPLTVGAVIDRMRVLDDYLRPAFLAAVRGLLAASAFREALRTCGVGLLPQDKLTADRLRRRARDHRLIFVERFSAFAWEEGLAEDGRGVASWPPELTMAQAKRTPALAGLLNLSTWFAEYDEAYLSRLAAKDLGYRASEIYMTDSKATLVSDPRFWDEATAGTRANSLTVYQRDLLLATEYVLSRSALVSTARRYYRAHADVRRLETDPPLQGLEVVVLGQALVARIEESLDLSLLVDHGFTRLFMTQMFDERGVTAALDAVRQRVRDAADVVELRSSVAAAESTAQEGLAAAKTNNKLQWTILTVTVTSLIIALVGAFVLPRFADSPAVRLPEQFCVSQTPEGFAVSSCPDGD